MTKRMHVAFAVALLCAPAAWTADTPEQAATKSAEAFLALVDNGRYDESWDAAAKLFQGAVTREKWKEALTATRTPLGKLVSRGLKVAKHTTSLPGAPDGQYVVVQFATSFENKKEAVETVTPMQEKDGSWRVSGYFIR
ncbi:MAG: DUF4019 domain-containing protein [Vicinamibacteria bacterium]